MTTKECEFDPDHLYHDHREADELRALLEKQRQLIQAYDRTASELRAENERLRADYNAAYKNYVAQRDENERLRAALNAIVQEPLDEHVRIAMETLNTRLWIGNAKEC